MKTLDVYGLYGESWQGEIVPDAFAHPAKFSRALIRWIYQHCLEEGYIKPGDKVVDPFGGVGLGGLDAMRNGLHWQGVELEEKFVLLGQGGDCDGNVKVERKLVHIEAKPGYKGWYVRDRLQVKYGSPGEPVAWFDGEPVGLGWPTEEDAIKARDFISQFYEGGELTIEYYEEDRIEEHDEWQEIIKPATCGLTHKHDPHHIQGNIELWNERYGQWFANWGTAQLIQGDSRQLAGLVCGAQACVGSPPYAGQELSQAAGGNIELHNELRQDVKRRYGQSNGQLGSMPEGSIDAAITSPPFGEGETRNRSSHQEGAVSDMMTRAYTQDKQGTTEGNLATLKADTEGYAAAIGSPPYASGAQHTGGKDPKPEHIQGGELRYVDYGGSNGQLGAMKEGNLDAAIGSPPYADAVSGSGEGPGARHDPIHHKGDNAHKKSSQSEYGSTPGNLGNMAASIGSPPYEASLRGDRNGIERDKITYSDGRANTATSSGQFNTYGYSQDTEGQLGNNQGETFWQAAKTIVEQVYMVLRPGGYAIFVTGDFVRNGKRVYFGRQWLQLCKSLGFQAIEWIVAHKSEYKGTQLGLFGEHEEKRVDRVSFFRRLANEKNPDNAILNEDVIILRKPE